MNIRVATALTPNHPTEVTTPLLTANNLNLAVDTRHGRSVVLRDINFVLPHGKILGLVGESGAGKSMLGRIIARQLPENFEVLSGSLNFDGQNLLTVPADQHRHWLGKRIAFIPQEPMTALNPVLTIGQQFTEHMHRIGYPAQECRDRIVAALTDVLLPDPAAILDKYAFQLSGGMCQRVMIAMAFASKPELVISDEATTALDVSSQAQVIRLLKNLQAREGTSVIFVTHDIGLATHVCDELAVLYAGEMMEYAPAKRLFSNAAHPYTRALRDASPNLTGPLHELAILPGQMPGVESFAKLKGCRFASRCRHREAACEQQIPSIQTRAPEHWVRCFKADDIRHLNNQNQLPPKLGPGAAFSHRPILTAADISKTYAAGPREKHTTAALAPLNFDISPGEFIGIVGESGSGKSTLGRVLMGLETLSSGEICLHDRPLGKSEQEWQRRISTIQMIFQDARSALNPRRRVGKLLTQAMDSRPHQRLERKLRMQDLAHDVGLPDVALNRYPGQLSGGQRQRVNIGRSLCDLPQILIADEIVSGLDVSVQAQIMKLLLQLRAEHKISLIIISHDLGVVRYLCSRVLVMRKGEVIESGCTEEVLNNPQHPYTRQLIAAVPPTDPGQIWPPKMNTNEAQA